VQQRLSEESAGRWLLIFDNADELDVWTKSPRATTKLPGLLDYLPRSNLGFLLFMTRSRKIAVRFAQHNVIEVPNLDEQAASHLFSKCLIDQSLLEDCWDTHKLLQQLTFLPLAIVQAAAYINANGTTLSEYLSLLGGKEQGIIDLLSEDFDDDGRYQGTKNPIATIWLVSFEQIRYIDPLAAEYLSFISCLDCKGIPQQLLPPASSKKKSFDAVGTLSAYSFITERKSDQSLDLCPLVHLTTRNWLRQQGLLEVWTQKAVDRLAGVFPDIDHKNKPLWGT
jgi:hypothetical protein